MLRTSKLVPKWDPFHACRFRFESVWMRCLHYFGALNMFGWFLSISHIYLLLYFIIYSFAIDFFSLNSNNDRKKENSIYREDWFWNRNWFSLFLLISIINCQLKNQQVQLYPLSCCACTILLLRVLLESFKA